MKKNFVLIDYENVQPALLAGLPPEHFRVTIFLGPKQKKYSSSGGGVEYVRISRSGRNALDFHIAFYVGLYAARDPKAAFHIISKDKDYDPLIEHLKSRQIAVVRSPSIDAIRAIKNGAAKSPGERARAFVEKLRQTFNKPRTTKALSNSIKTFFQKDQLSDDETEKVIAAMRSQGRITVKDEKITYAL